MWLLSPEKERSFNSNLTFLVFLFFQGSSGNLTAVGEDPVRCRGLVSRLQSTVPTHVQPLSHPSTRASCATEETSELVYSGWFTPHCPVQSSLFELQMLLNRNKPNPLGTFQTLALWTHILIGTRWTSKGLSWPLQGKSQTLPWLGYLDQKSTYRPHKVQFIIL